MSYAIRPPWWWRQKAMMMGGRGGWGGYMRGGFGPGPFFAGGPKVGRGEVRIAILQLLTEQPMHGYQIMQELSKRTSGVWRLSPGSVYPTLQQLEDEGLVRADRQDGKNVYSLTDDGRAAVESEATTPWETLGGGVHDELFELRDIGFQVGAAVIQVARTGSTAQVAKAKEILENARREIYRLLAEDHKD
ncbi:MAG: PadR family transcriptional regulator [Actinobacteria bacterium]|nr:PadR family transcriptional regulator [Actinomycetota bacterium]